MSLMGSSENAMSVEITDCLFEVRYQQFKCLVCSPISSCRRVLLLNIIDDSTNRNQNNQLSFGTLSNIGGTLTVYKSLFVQNSAMVSTIN